jgi:hypothetical protein
MLILIVTSDLPSIRGHLLEGSRRLFERSCRLMERLWRLMEGLRTCFLNYSTVMVVFYTGLRVR